MKQRSLSTIIQRTNFVESCYMKSILFFISLFIAYSSFSQSSLRFESRKVYLGEIEINNAYGINFSYENVSEKPIMLSYEPITNLVNTTYKKQAIAPGEKGTLKVNFYPEEEGPFNEQLYIIVNEKEKIELSVLSTQCPLFLIYLLVVTMFIMEGTVILKELLISLIVVKRNQDIILDYIK